MRAITKSIIQLYQIHLSPHKGFRCAYGVHHGGDSCSTKVMTIIDTAPITQWLPKIRSQFTACTVAYQQIQEELDNKKRKKKKKKKSSACCDPIDCCDIPGSIDLDCCDCNPF